MIGIEDGRTLEEKLMGGDLDARLERIGRTPVWELMPSPLHQATVREIERSARPSAGETDCACYTLADTYIRFPDGSLRRPDIAIFCRVPPVLGREALTVVPEAVVEVLSPEGEMKDLQLGPPSYLANGVRDVVVVDPESEVCTHFRRDGVRTLRRGAIVSLEMGCEITL